MADAVFDFREQVERGSATPDGEAVDSLTDEELLRLYRDRRGPEAFSAMVRRHHPMVLRTCQRLLGNAHDAEDAAQSVFLVLIQRPEAVRRSLAGWLYGQAQAAVSELCRSRRRRSEREELAARLNSMFARLSGRDRPMEHHDLAEELDAALAQLPDRLQQAVILRYLEGHSQQEAAQQAGCTTVTMGWRSMKGLQRLRAILGRRGVAASSAVLLTVLESEARAAAALALTAIATKPATAAAASLATVLVKRSLLWASLRKAALVAALVTGTGGLGASVVFWPRAKPDDPQKAVRAPAPKPTPPADVPALGMFDRSMDIGQPKRPGSARFAGDVYTVQGGGTHIYGNLDQFRFVCQPWTGDGEIVARIASDPDQDARQVSAGVMFRESLSADSQHVAVLLSTADGQVKYRTPESPASACVISPLGRPGIHWVRLVRRGDRFTASVRADGAETWTLVKELDLVLKPSLFVGLAVTAHDDAQLATTTFDRVSVRRP